MRISPRVWSYLLLPLAALTTTGLFAAERLRPEPPRACNPALVEALEWAKSNGRKLPTSLADFATYSIVQRQAIYTQLSPEVRVRMWQEHLAPHLASSSPLSTEQRALVQHFHGNLSIYVTDPTGEVGRTAMEKVRLPQRIRELFPGEEARIFNLIASTGEPAPLADGSEPPLCSCNTAYPDPAECPSGLVTCRALGNCIALPYAACGDGNQYPCNGLCYIG